MLKFHLKSRNSLSHIAEVIYPVGSIYMSTNSTSPATLFGFGTWTRIEGKFLLGATDGGTGSGASYIAGATGGVASVTLTAAQSGVPAHSHGNTIKATTPSLSHSSITQPAFTTPKFTHSITQPVFKYTAPKSHTHNLTNGYAYMSVSSSIRYRYKSLTTNWTAQYGTSASLTAGTYTSSHADVVTLGGNADSASAADTANGATASRTTNVGVGDHAATACTRSTDVAVGAHAATDCTMSGSISNNTATDATSAHTNMPPFQAVYIWYRSA